MTPEETKAHVENRLRELGWSVHIGSTGYEKISRFTGGSEAGVSRLCHKLVSLGALQERREITDDVVEMAMMDLGRSGEAAGAAAADGRGNGGREVDWGSIEELAAQLETKVATTNGEAEWPVRSQRAYAGNGGAAATAAHKQAVEAFPKVLLVDSTKDSRARFAKALSKDFRVIEAADGEEAWKTLLSRTDIELLVTDLTIPKVDGYDLIKRLRGASAPLHLVGIPVIVMAAPENAGAKMRVLMTGANDFIAKNTDPAELRARVVARHKLNKAASRIAVVPAGATRPAAFGSARAPAAAKARPVSPVSHSSGNAKGPTARGPVTTLTAESRYRDEARTPRRADLPPRSPPDKAGGRGNATMTITVGATALLVLAIVVIGYLGQDDERPRVTREAIVPPEPTAPPMAEQGRTQPAAPSDDARRSAEPQPPPVERPLPPLAKSTPPAETKEPISRAPPQRESTEPEPAPRIAPPDADVPAPRTSPPPEGRVPAPAPGAPAVTAPAQAPQPRPEPLPTPVPPRASAPDSPATRAPAQSPEQIEAAEAGPNRDELALVEPPPAVVRPAPPPSRISRDELSTLLSRFASVYEAGDLEQFMSLFAENARTNDRNGRGGIREDYEALFRTTDLRQMNLGEISWEVEGNQAQGWGEFDVSVRRRGEQKPYVYTGSLTFVVEKVDGRLRIVRLYHGQRRVES